jgi:hypothetical protein
MGPVFPLSGSQVGSPSSRGFLMRLANALSPSVMSARAMK